MTWPWAAVCIGLFFAIAWVLRAMVVAAVAMEPTKGISIDVQADRALRGATPIRRDDGAA